MNTIGDKQDQLIYIYILLIDSLSIANELPFMHICSAGLGVRSFKALGLGPGPVSIMAEHMCIKGNQQAINRQRIIGNLNI